MSAASQTVEELEPLAADRLDDDEHDCAFGEACNCDNSADWLIEMECGVVFACCQPCSEYNRIYARENEVYRNDVSDAGWERFNHE